MNKLNKKEKAKAALGVFLFFLIGIVSCYWTQVSIRGLIETEWNLESFRFIFAYLAGTIVAGISSITFLGLIGVLFVRAFRRPIQSR